MEISIQYLEDTPARAAISAPEARRHLREAFDRVQLKAVLLGWDLEPALIDACAEECQRNRAELYLWQPILTGRRRYQPDPAWRAIALDGRPAGAQDEKIEFSFLCPNRPEVLEGALRMLDAALASGSFQGVFLDRIRFPSPSLGFDRDLGCFCDCCQEAAGRAGFDLSAARNDLLRQLEGPEGRREAISCLLAPHQATRPGPGGLAPLLDFRSASITAFIKAISDAVRARGLKVGLDCFAPTLTRMVGQDLKALGPLADWIELMTYARAYGHASLPFEILGLVDYVIEAGGETEASAIDMISKATGWHLPGLREVIRSGGLPALIITEELRRGRARASTRLLAGIELLEIPDVSRLDRRQIAADAQAVLAAAPDGVVLSWDLWHMPAWRLELAASLYGKR